MKKDNLNINSTEWCDMVFENKNKSYGAYALRQSSSKRHLIAFGSIVLFVAVVAVLPALISTIEASTRSETEGITGPVIFSNIPVNEPVVEIPEVKIEQPVLKEAKTIAFTPPVITADENITEADPEMKTVDDVVKSKGFVGVVDNPDGSLDRDAFIVTKPNPDQSAITGTPDVPPVTFAEIMPQFPGGDQEMYRHIAQSLKYPVIDQENGIGGRVTVRFVVTKTGEINDVTVLRGVSMTCDKEAVRVIKGMPRWIPGKQNGNAVAVYYTLPIVFRLQQ